jgi:hypothetical protein
MTFCINMYLVHWLNKLYILFNNINHLKHAKTFCYFNIKVNISIVGKLPLFIV